jgi:hypothetical protein
MAYSSIQSEFSLAPEAPIRRLVPITPNDNADLPEGPARLLVISGGGRIAVVPMKNANDEPVYLNAFPSENPYIVPVVVRRVLETGTATPTSDLITANGGAWIFACYE